MKNNSKCKKSTSSSTSSIDQNEIKRFTKDADSWWDEDGAFAPLHKLNPVRMQFVKEQISELINHDFSSIDILDVGCGGGLVSEALAKEGANVTGLDADPKAIKIAKTHASNSNLQINYVNGDIQFQKKKYNVVIALEIIEHVNSVDLFIEQCIKCLKPDGLLIISTVNRTAKSYALGIIAAEYILGWVPKGTHNWHRFTKPSEIATYARKNALVPVKVNGLVYSPLNREFSLSGNNLDVNYIMSMQLKL